MLADPLPWWDWDGARSGIQILLAQAQVERLTLVTKDALLGAYGLPVLW